MCDFEDDFNDGDFINEDTELNGSFAGDSEFEDETDNPESIDDDFTAKDAFIIGGAFGFGYEEGLRERKRRKLKKFSDSD